MGSSLRYDARALSRRLARQSVTDVAKRAGLSRRMVTYFKAGQVSPRATTLARLMTALGVTDAREFFTHRRRTT